MDGVVCITSSPWTARKNMPGWNDCDQCDFGIETHRRQANLRDRLPTIGSSQVE